MKRALTAALATVMLLLAVALVAGFGLGYWPPPAPVCQTVGFGACMGLYLASAPLLFLLPLGAIAVITRVRPRS